MKELISFTRINLKYLNKKSYWLIRKKGTEDTKSIQNLNLKEFN